MRFIFKILFLAVAMLSHPLFVPGHAVSAEPAAVVEVFKGQSIKLAHMQILEEGRVLALKPGEILIIGYFKSCVRETITGGTVLIGENESAIKNASSLNRSKITCDGRRLSTRAGNAQEVAGGVIRETNAGADLPEPDKTLFGLSPMVRLTSGAKLRQSFSPLVIRIRILRLDRREKPAIVETRDRFADYAATGIRLAPGGLYQVSSGRFFKIIRVASDAIPDAPLLARLVFL